MKLNLILLGAIAAFCLSASSAEAGGVFRPRTKFSRPARPAIMVQPVHRHAPVRFYFYDYRPFDDRDTTAYGEG